MKQFVKLPPLRIFFFPTVYHKQSNSPYKQYSIENLPNTESLAGISLTYDEKQVIYFGDKDGIYSIYSIILCCGLGFVKKANQVKAQVSILAFLEKHLKRRITRNLLFII